MSGAKKTWNGIREGADKVGKQINRTGKRIEKNLKNPGDSMGQFMRDIGVVPEIPEPEEQVIIPIPDENSAALEAKRRRARAPKTGRDSTILTEGLGG